MMPSACTFDALYTFANLTSGSGTATFTLFVNDAQPSSTLTCANAGAVGSNTTCSDTAHTVSVSAGQLVSMKVAWSVSSPPFGRIGFSLHCH